MIEQNKGKRIIVIGAGIGGLTAAALLAQAGHHVIVLEAQTYPGGSASTFLHKGYRFESGATVAGGFQPNGPHAIAGRRLGIEWRVRPHEPAWVVHLTDRSVALTNDNADVLAKFPHSTAFWAEQSQLADMGWSLSAQGLPWPPTSIADLAQLMRVGLGNFPRDVQILPFALMTAYQWLALRGMSNDPAFVRFIDAQLLISSQTTSRGANAMYSATALDLARQGTYHVEGGIGGLAEQLVEAVRGYGGEVLYRQRAARIEVENGRAVRVITTTGKRSARESSLPADFVLANLTPWSLDTLLGEASPAMLRRETETRRAGWGAYVLHLGVRADAVPSALHHAQHHQVIATMKGKMGEGRSIFLSMSPDWDATRAPEGHRAITMTTHTDVQTWWNLLAHDPTAYGARKAEYRDRMLNAVERVLPGITASIALEMQGTPLTYEYYIGRHLGMVGGFPQTSLFKARSPLTGIENLRLVGDSIFPGQSTAGVTLGGMRVADDVIARLPKPDAPRVFTLSSLPRRELEEETLSDIILEQTP